MSRHERERLLIGMFHRMFYRNINFAVFFLAMVAISNSIAAQETMGPITVDAVKVLGYEACAKCHQGEVQVWKQTPHHRTFREMHRNPHAKEISQKMGIRSIKRGDVCIDCHYTQQNQGGKTKAISGISCESCHGPATDWIKLHNDYGGPNVTKEQESAAHKLERRTTSIAAGMRNPMNVYLIARSCLNCHTVPNEKLVNVGGHRAASTTFDLVAWSQGSIRHNFVRGNGTNTPSSTERLRLMYVVGMMTDLEYSLRATAKATAVETYGYAVAARAHLLRIQLAQLQDTLHNQYLQPAVDAALNVKLKTENQENLIQAANQVGAAAYAFAENVKGSQLGVVDSMLPSPSQYK